MLAAPTGRTRGKVDPHHRVIVIGKNNEAEDRTSISDAISHDKPFILDRSRPDLVCVDFDNVPRSVVRNLVRRHLARQESYVLVPSGGRSVRLPNGRARLHRYHLFVVAKSPATARALRQAIKAVRQEMQRQAAVEEWSARVEVVIRAAIRGPLFAHRFRDRTERLRHYCSRYPSVLSAIVDVFEMPSGWLKSELAAEVDRRTRVGPTPPAAPPGATSDVEEGQLLDLLNAHQASGDTDSWSAAYALVNRLEARGFSADQVWVHRDHPSLAIVVRGDEYPKSEGAGWRDLSKMFADAAQTRAHGRDALGLRDDVLAAAVMYLQKSAFKVVVAALASERSEMLTIPRSKRTFDRSVWLGQRSLGELADIGSPATVSAALRELQADGWIVWGRKQRVGTPRPFAVTLPRTIRSKLNNYLTRRADGRDRNGSQSRAYDARSKTKHDYQLPPSRGEQETRGEITTRARVGVRTLRALLRAHAFRVRGHPAPALQYILALLLGIDRRDLPVAASTLRRAIAALREDEVLTADGRLAPNFLEVLEVDALERHHVEAADRQKERNHKQRVAFNVERTMAVPTSRARRQRLRRLRDRNPVVAEEVLRILKKAHGPRWYAVQRS